MSLAPFAGGHPGQFLEIGVEVAAVSVSHAPADLLRLESRLLTEQSTCLQKPQPVAPCPEVHSVLRLHERPHGGRIRVYFRERAESMRNDAASVVLAFRIFRNSYVSGMLTQASTSESAAMPPDSKSMRSQ